MGFEQLEEGDMETVEIGEALAISVATVTGTEGASTFRLLGQIQKTKVLMLVDLGSSHCFVNEQIAA